MVAQTQIEHKPLSNAARRLIILDTAQMVADDLDRAEREHDDVEADYCRAELELLKAELATLPRGW